MKTYPGEQALAKAFQAGVEYRKANPRSIPEPPARPDPAAPLVGREVALGEKSFSVAVLSLGDVRRLVDQGHVSSVQGLTPATISTIAETVLPAARKNYPDLTREQLEEMLDLVNYKDALCAVTGAATMQEQQEAVFRAAIEKGVSLSIDGRQITVHATHATK